MGESGFYVYAWIDLRTPDCMDVKQPVQDLKLGVRMPPHVTLRERLSRIPKISWPHVPKCEAARQTPESSQDREFVRNSGISADQKAKNS
jgi:hypothetical protein